MADISSGSPNANGVPATTVNIVTNGNANSNERTNPVVVNMMHHHHDERTPNGQELQNGNINNNNNINNLQNNNHNNVNSSDVINSKDSYMASHEVNVKRIAQYWGVDSIDDVNAATAMLALKHGPKVFSETFQTG